MSMHRILLLLTVLGSLAPPAHASPPSSLGLHLGSHHIAPGQRFEETNPGVFLNWEDRLTWSLGLYRNSYGDMSWTAVVGFPLFTTDDFRAELFGGWAHYPDQGRKFRTGIGDVIPLGGLRLRYRQIFVNLIPSDGALTDGIVSFGLRVPLGRD